MINVQELRNMADEATKKVWSERARYIEDTMTNAAKGGASSCTIEMLYFNTWSLKLTKKEAAEALARFMRREYGVDTQILSRNHRIIISW